MDIMKFITEFKLAKTAEAKQELMKKHIKTTYVPYVEKLAACEKIILVSMYRKDDRTGKVYFRMDTPSQCVLFSMTVIEYYTDITYDRAVVFDHFDLLEKNGVLQYLIPEIERDYDAFRKILDMMMNDRVMEEQNLIGWLNNKTEALKLWSETSLEGIMEGLMKSPAAATIKA